MEVKKIDILESIMIAFFTFSCIRDVFTAGTIPCVIFSIGIAAIFLIFYHEKYIGVVLNIITSVLWTMLLSTLLSFIAIFRGRLMLTILASMVILYFMLSLHGLDIRELITGGSGTNFRTKDSVTQTHFDGYREQYERYQRFKEQLEPVFSQILSDPTSDDGIRTVISQYMLSMESAEKVNAEFTRISKKRRISLQEFNLVDEYIKQMKDLNRVFLSALNYLNHVDEDEESYQEQRYSQANTQTTTDSTSYFNGCDSLESVKTRYRDLCKVYHPDMGNGSPEEFDKIQKEYNILKERYGK